MRQIVVYKKKRGRNNCSLNLNAKFRGRKKTTDKKKLLL